MTIKPKAALVIDQFIDGDHTWSDGDQNKRGRLTKAADARCKELSAEGILIEGYTVSKSSDSTAPATVSKVKHDPNVIPDVPDQTRPETSWTAWVGTLQIGMRTVCNNCRCSLTYCHDESPRVWLDHATQGVVHFKPVHA